MTTKSISDLTFERRERERRARIALIREAGARVFAQHGYERATMAMVAREAELGKASLYYYFKTKRELFAHIVEHAAGALGEAVMRAVPPEATPLESVESVCRYALAYFLDHPERAALHLPLIAGGPEHLQSLAGDDAADRMMAAHGPFFARLGPIAERLPDGAALTGLLATLMLGLATKAAHGRTADLDRELELFLTLLRRAWELGPADEPAR